MPTLQFLADTLYGNKRYAAEFQQNNIYLLKVRHFTALAMPPKLRIVQIHVRYRKI